MASLLRFLFRDPKRAAIVCGILVAVLFGFVSYPHPELNKVVPNWQIGDTALSEADQQALLAARNGASEAVELTEEEFRARGFTYNASRLDTSGSRFLLQHTGADELVAGQVYVAEREIFAAPWWSPHRFIYEAAEAEIDAFGEVVDLTFERNVLGLVGLIVIDGLVGLAYGVVVGAIVSVLRGSNITPSPTRGDSIRHHALTRSSVR
ncbi:MAG TPA: hypothetical protein VFS30_10130 [Dehalococcoidia bacterium]|nr:hypothetical protein [Dehalococcoidia bacterium]